MTTTVIGAVTIGAVVVGAEAVGVAGDVGETSGAVAGPAEIVWLVD